MLGAMMHGPGGTLGSIKRIDRTKERNARSADLPIPQLRRRNSGRHVRMSPALVFPQPAGTQPHLVGIQGVFEERDDDRRTPDHSARSAGHKGEGMNPQKPQIDQHWDDIYSMFFDALVADHLRSHPDSNFDECLHLAAEADRLLTETADRIRGNRSVESKPSWEDLRLALTACHRKCLQILEGECCSVE
jgi:hypothetical protein